MKTKIIAFFTTVCTVITLYALPPKTVTTCGENLYVALDWNKPVTDLSKVFFDKLIKAQTDSTRLFLSFYEDGLIDQYGNRFIFISDTIEVRTFRTFEVRRFKNDKYFSNIFNFVDTVVRIKGKFNKGINLSQIDSVARLDAENISLTEQELTNKIAALDRQFHIFYETNPYNPLDKSHLRADYIDLPPYANSLYFITNLNRLLYERSYYEKILYLKYPSHSVAPPLSDDIE